MEEASMQKLVMLVGVMASAMVADVGWATTYVPGQIRDGVYLRPHFVVVSERATSENGDSSGQVLPEGVLPEGVTPDPALPDRPAIGAEATESAS
jgi:hypothetical protein